MTNRGVWIVLLCLALAALTAALWPRLMVATSDEKIFEGELVDSRCFLKLGARGEAHQGCAKTCAKSGLPAGVVTAEGKYYTLAVQPSALVDYLAKTVRVTGVENQGTIVPSKIEVKKGVSWQAVRLPEQMM